MRRWGQCGVWALASGAWTQKELGRYMNNGSAYAAQVVSKKALEAIGRERIKKIGDRHEVVLDRLMPSATLSASFKHLAAVCFGAGAALGMTETFKRADDALQSSLCIKAG